MGLIDPLEYIKYDKISDDIFWINNNILLKFTVLLSNINQKGERNIFHKEFEYRSNKIGSNLITIKRSFDYYLSIESIGNNKDRVFIPFRNIDMPMLLYSLEEVYKWFNDKKYDGLYATKNNRLIMTNPIPEVTTTSGSGSFYIKFEPTIIINNTGIDDIEPGVKLYLSDSNNIINITLSKFMGLKYIIDRFNLYESAILLINYIQRPDLGYFKHVFSDTNYNDNDAEYLISQSQKNQYNNKEKNDVVRRVLPSDRNNNFKLLE